MKCADSIKIDNIDLENMTMNATCMVEAANLEEAISIARLTLDSIFNGNVMVSS